MLAEIISIGDELLIGQTINTNASWLGSELANIGIKVKHVQTISDERESIINAMDLALNRADIVLITGGLGPTKDDITKHVLCEYFVTELEIDEEALASIEAFFAKRNRPMLEVNRLQATLPKSCTKIVNTCGTASGMWFDKDGKVLVSMPGVPYEMKTMMTDFILPRIKTQFKTGNLFQKTLVTTGIGESFLAEKIAAIEDELLSNDFSLAYLPSPGIVKLRISSFRGQVDEDQVNSYFKAIAELIPEHIVGFGNITLVEKVIELISIKNYSIALAESCTGGQLASAFTAISGVSAVFKGSTVTYHEEAKSDILGIDNELIKQFGVVSKEVAENMAKEAQKKFKADVSLATTGCVGPTCYEGVDVGEIWIGLAIKNQIFSKKINLGDNRERNIQMAVLAALNYLKNQLV